MNTARKYVKLKFQSRGKMKKKQMLISQKFREIRENNKLNFSEMGRNLDISHTAVIKIENGEAMPALPTLFKLWRIFGVNPVEIVSLYEPKSTNSGGQIQENQ
jgi:DNA-binding XRE family transcriptional regulator